MCVFLPTQTLAYQEQQAQDAQAPRVRKPPYDPADELGSLMDRLFKTVEVRVRAFKRLLS